jgi:D-alanyl-D-alanine carboxypeptidase
MYRVPVEATRRLRWGLLSLVTVAAMLATTIDSADARKRKRGPAKRATQAEAYSPKHASIVIDAKTGATLHQSNADSIRHPASLTKIMTLYMLFERLEAGTIKLNSQMEVSPEAASQPPTKLGVRPGQTLAVEDAIKGLVTKSANDAAVVIAEALAGSEDEFARQMTREARSLGMRNTVYRNASGLPDPGQVTTAREQALLGIAIQERFPRYYRYFSTSSFTYAGRAMRNHNKLLGRVEGVDGIKTGYIRASGFNLVSSVKRADRHIVAVVLGGRTGALRDAKMRSLIEGHIMEASVKRTNTRIVDAAPTAPASDDSAAPDTAPVVEAIQPRPAPRLAAAASVPVTVESKAGLQAPRLGSTDPIKPVTVRTVMVKMTAPKPAPGAKTLTGSSAASVQAAHSAPPEPVHTAALASVAASPLPAPQSLDSALPPSPAGARPGIRGVLPAASENVAHAVPMPVAAPERRPVSRGGWAIQIGAFDAESEAKQKLNVVKSKAAALLGSADPRTERANKGQKTFYRARFVGFDREQAEAACKQLKRSDIACMALKI